MRDTWCLRSLPRALPPCAPPEACALYVLEANPGGNTWHFSSKLAEEGRKEISREQRIEQMDAWGVAARVLAERTRAEAS